MGIIIINFLNKISRTFQGLAIYVIKSFMSETIIL